MRMRWKIANAAVCVSVVCAAFAQGPEPQPATPTAPHRAKVSEEVASSLVVEQTPLKYPNEARSAGIQGTVTLKVVVGETGGVKEVSVVSGNPLLAQAAT